MELGIVRFSALPQTPPLDVPSTRETAAVVGKGEPARRALGGRGLQVFPLALDAKEFGWRLPAAKVFTLLDLYASLGGNFLDTADSYGEGLSEKTLGEWFTSRGARDRFVIATKVGKSAAHPGLSGVAVTSAVTDSLRRLGTDRIDLLYLHTDDISVPFEETLLAVDGLIRSGKVGAFGMSDHTGTRLLAARIACAVLGVAPMLALQNEYSLLSRSGYEGDLARIAAQQGLAVMPRFPLAHGLLRQFPPQPGGAHLNHKAKRVVKMLSRLAVSHHSTPGAVALAWLLSKTGVVAPVVSAKTPEELIDLMSAPTVSLTRHQLAELDRVSAPVRRSGLAVGQSYS